MRAILLAHNMWIRPWGLGSEGHTRCGYTLWHRHPKTREVCPHSFAVCAEHGAGRPVWTVEQEEPLTLSPSLNIPGEIHGWILEGRWVSA